MRAPLAALLLRAAAATLVAASPALAQSPAVDAGPSPAADAAPTRAPGDSAPAAASATPPRGPTLDGARAGVNAPRPTDERSATAFAPSRGGMGQPVALMIVGGAAVVVGLIVGDTGGNLLAFGGAVVGLVGLFQYLR